MSRVHIFPGQGAQFSGMGKELYFSNSRAREMMESANDILGYRLTDIMFSGTDSQLQETRITQPAIFLHSTALALCSDGLRTPDMVGGHSLGEFPALVAAGVVSFEDGLRLVALRAALMQKCCENHPGTMATVIGMDPEKVGAVCAKVNGTVVCANYNYEEQTVISGDMASIAEACRLLSEAGAKRALRIAVGGAFHSPLMSDAASGLKDAIMDTDFRKPVCPVFQNVSAQAETVPDRIRRNLILQLTSPVLWSRSVENMLAAGADHFVEIGPGKVLQGLVKRIASDAGKDVLIEGIQ